MGLLRGAVAILLVGLAAGKRWGPDSLAEPYDAGRESVCGKRYGRSFVCDPDGLLSREGRRALDRNCALLRNPQGLDAGYDPNKKCVDGYEVRAAVVRYIARESGESRSSATERMAQTLLMDWNLGECGVMVFVSMGDRRVFIATGHVVGEVLDSRSLNKIVSDMTPYLKRNDPTRALLTAIHEMEQTLRPAAANPGYGTPGYPPEQPSAVTPTHHGTPSAADSFWGWELKTTLIVALIALFFAFKNRKGVAEPKKGKVGGKPKTGTAGAEPENGSGALESENGNGGAEPTNDISGAQRS